MVKNCGSRYWSYEFHAASGLSASVAMSLDRDAGFAYSGAATRPQVDTPFYVARYTYRKYMA